MTSFVVRQERCPKCAERGKDNGGDNLAVYSDGHKFCFSCKYVMFPDGVASLKNRELPIEKPLTIFLPQDCNMSYPQRAIDWIEQYSLSRNDLINNNTLWSESLQRLIFPILGNDGELLAWQGRSFSLNQSSLTHKTIPKWFGKGNLKDCFNILGKGDKLILTEDIISAIKVSKCGVMAMPLYGCTVGRERFKRLYSLYKDTVEILVWLDPDKRTEAIKEAKLGRLCGVNCSAVFSSFDPKEIEYKHIEEIVEVLKENTNDN